MKDIIPKISSKKLQKAANEAAQKGAIETIERFYTGYDSPFKKQIEEDLKNKGVNYAFDLPDVIGVINEVLNVEISKIANRAVAETFVPLVAKILTRTDAEMKMSDVLEEFIKYSGFEYNDSSPEDYEMEIVNDDSSFRYVLLTGGDKQVQFHLSCFDKAPEDEKEWKAYTLPVNKNKDDRYFDRTMDLQLGEVTLKIPFVPNVLSDDFTSFVAGLIMAQTKIKFDVDGFNEDMFPEDNCHC